MLLKSICIFFITNCFAKDLIQSPHYAILHENIHSASEPSNAPVDYFDSINLPNPDYKFSYLFEQQRKGEEPQVEQRDEEIGKYMNIQQPTTMPTTTTTEQQQHIDLPCEKEEQQVANYGQAKTSMKMLESHHINHKEVTSTVPPMPPAPKLHSNQSPHFPPSYWNYLNNHGSAIPANHIHRHQSSTGILKWNKSPKSDASDLTGLHFPTHEWNPIHIRHPSHHEVHVSPVTSKAPVTEYSVAPKLHLSTHDLKPGHIGHLENHVLKESPATSKISIEESSTLTGNNFLAHDSKPTHITGRGHNDVNESEGELSASTGLHLQAPTRDSESNHLRHPSHHDLPVTTEIVEVSTISTETQSSTQESPTSTKNPNYQAVHKSYLMPENPVEESSTTIDLNLSSHVPEPENLRHPIYHEANTPLTTPETPAKEYPAKFGTRLSNHGSIPNHLNRHIHHEIHTSPTIPETITESSNTQTLHTNQVTNQKLVPTTSQHVPPLRRQNGHVKVNRRIKKVKKGPVGHNPRPVYRGSYKFRLDDVNDMHTSSIRRIKTAKTTHQMGNSPPPPVPTLSPWYDGYGK